MAIMASQEGEREREIMHKSREDKGNTNRHKNETIIPIQENTF